MDTFFTWQALSAMGGASLLTFFIVAYTKSIVRLQTDIYAVLVAYGVLLAANMATGASAADWRVYVLTFANAFLVAAAAGQMNNKVVNPPALQRTTVQPTQPTPIPVQPVVAAPTNVTNGETDK